MLRAFGLCKALLATQLLPDIGIGPWLLSGALQNGRDRCLLIHAQSPLAHIAMPNGLTTDTDGICLTIIRQRTQ